MSETWLIIGIILFVVAILVQLYSVFICLNGARKGKHVSQVYFLPLFFWYAGAAIYGKPILLDSRWSEFAVAIACHLLISAGIFFISRTVIRNFK